MQYATTVLGILFLTFLMSTYFYVFIFLLVTKSLFFASTIGYKTDCTTPLESLKRFNNYNAYVLSLRYTRSIWWLMWLYDCMHNAARGYMRVTLVLMKLYGWICTSARKKKGKKRCWAQPSVNKCLCATSRGLRENSVGS